MRSIGENMFYSIIRLYLGKLLSIFYDKKTWCGIEVNTETLCCIQLTRALCYWHRRKKRTYRREFFNDLKLLTARSSQLRILLEHARRI